MGTFEDYLKEARNDFCAKINGQEWNTELRTASESFLIAYDQVVDKYLENNRKKVTKNNIIKFQDMLVETYSTKDTILRKKFELFRDSYVSIIEELKSELCENIN